MTNNKHDYNNKDPKTNNDNQEQSIGKNTFKAETKIKQNNNEIKQIISFLRYPIGNIIERNGNKV